MAKNLTVAASITIHRAADLSPGGKRRVLAWLTREIKFIKKNSKKLSKRYIARYLCND